jgi:hypothetical protein
VFVVPATLLFFEEYTWWGPQWLKRLVDILGLKERSLDSDDDDVQPARLESLNSLGVSTSPEGSSSSGVPGAGVLDSTSAGYGGEVRKVELQLVGESRSQLI